MEQCESGELFSYSLLTTHLVLLAHRHGHAGKPPSHVARPTIDTTLALAAPGASSQTIFTERPTRVPCGDTSSYSSPHSYFTGTFNDTDEYIALLNSLTRDIANSLDLFVDMVGPNAHSFPRHRRYI